MTVTDIVMLLFVGLGAGTLGGFLGIGGSVIMIPALLLLVGPDIHVYQAAAMIINCLVAFAAYLRHRQAGAVVPRVVAWMLPGAIAGVIVGVALSSAPAFTGQREGYLAAAFGAFLCLLALHDVYFLLPRRSRPAPPSAPLDPARIPARGLSLRSIAGALGGLLGIGSGVITVPGQQWLLRLPIRNAVANSAAVMMAFSAVGAVAKNAGLVYSGVRLTYPLGLAAVLAPGALAGAYLGGGLTHRLNPRYIRLAFTAILLFGGLQLIRRALSP